MGSDPFAPVDRALRVAEGVGVGCLWSAMEGREKALRLVCGCWNNVQGRCSEEVLDEAYFGRLAPTG